MFVYASWRTSNIKSFLANYKCFDLCMQWQTGRGTWTCTRTWRHWVQERRWLVPLGWCRRQERLIGSCLPLPGGDRLPPCCEHPFPGLLWINLWIHSDPSCYASGINTNIFLQSTQWITACFRVDDHVQIRFGLHFNFVQTLVKQPQIEYLLPDFGVAPNRSSCKGRQWQFLLELLLNRFA
jgi:hypothetical protein